MSLRSFAQIGIVIFLFYLSYAGFIGVTRPIPVPGDSWDYHIPISKMILSGEIFSPKHPIINQWYYPGSSEAINSIFIFLGIPLTLSNILAVVVLFFVCWKIASIFSLKYYESIFFATCIVTLNSVVRWYNAVNIDIWFVNFFLLAIILLERPRSSWKYFLLLGFALGMLIGTKYTGMYYLAFLLVFYFRKLRVWITLHNAVIFLIPFALFGLSWYIRNYLLFHNPFYPLYFLGTPSTINFDKHIWDIFLLQPVSMVNAFFSEYKIWLFAIPLVITLMLNTLKKAKFKNVQGFYEYRLEILVILSFLAFLLSPTDTKSWIMVSSMRYSYPAFILAILVIFRYCKQRGQLNYLAVLSIASMIMVTSFNYYPKLVIIYGPLALLVCFLLERYKKQLMKLFS